MITLFSNYIKEKYSIKNNVLNKNGKPLIVYHGDRENIKKFNVPINKYVMGFFTTTSKDVAKYFGKQIYSMNLIMNKPFIIDAEDNNYLDIKVPKQMRKDIISTIETVDVDLISSWAYKNGYDGVIIKNVVEGNGNTKTSDVYIVFNEKQIINIQSINYKLYKRE